MSCALQDVYVSPNQALQRARIGRVAERQRSE